MNKKKILETTNLTEPKLYINHHWMLFYKVDIFSHSEFQNDHHHRIFDKGSYVFVVNIWVIDNIFLL